MSATTAQRWKPSVPVSSASDQKSFAYESTVKRWPTILGQVVDEIARLNGTLDASKDVEKLKEGKEIINAISGLIYEMRHDRALSPLTDTGAPHDTSAYNDELAEAAERKENTWFSASWLYAECYMYRRVRGLFAASKEWNQFDPFLAQKQSAFRSSAKGVVTLASSMEKLVEKGKVTDEEELHAEWTRMLEVCLWGNATDLSLLTSLTHEDIQALQSVERGASFVLKNDFAECWNYFKNVRDARVDIVLDNSGFELFSDLVLADWLVTLSPFCSHVVFHPKVLPWFVSDVQPHDFRITIESLLDPAFFPDHADISSGDRAALKTMVERWQRYVDGGVFRLSVPLASNLGDEQSSHANFWTTPYPFSDLPAKAPELLEDLATSSLVIFKGDLNYRKLTSDGCWPTTTPFIDTLGPLAGAINLLSLRTCKADVCVGLQEGKQEELDRDDPTWRVSGKYAVVSFVPKSS